MPYTFSDDYRYKKLTLRSIENLCGLQIPISDNIFFKHCGGYTRYGYCAAQDHPAEPRFVISVNSYFLTEKDVEETIVHESKKAKHHMADKVCDGYFGSLPWIYSAWARSAAYSA